MTVSRAPPGPCRPLTHRAFLGLGGNLGDAPATIARGLRALDTATGLAIAAVSPLYRTPPWGNTGQPPFFNCCALAMTNLPPLALLDLCLATETRLHRVRRERWGPRTMDIDVLTYDERTIDHPRLTVPHPLMHERAFVLVPLAMLDASLVVRGRAVAEWAAQTDVSGIEPMFEDAGWWLGADT